MASRFAQQHQVPRVEGTPFPAGGKWAKPPRNLCKYPFATILPKCQTAASDPQFQTPRSERMARTGVPSESNPQSTARGGRRRYAWKPGAAARPLRDDGIASLRRDDGTALHLPALAALGLEGAGGHPRSLVSGQRPAKNLGLFGSQILGHLLSRLTAGAAGVAPPERRPGLHHAQLRPPARHGGLAQRVDGGVRRGRPRGHSLRHLLPRARG